MTKWTFNTVTAKQVLRDVWWIYSVLNRNSLLTMCLENPAVKMFYPGKIKVLTGTKLSTHGKPARSPRVCVYKVFTCRRAVGYGDVSGQVGGGVTAVEESRKRHDCGGTDTWRDGTNMRLFKCEITSLPVEGAVPLTSVTLTEGFFYGSETRSSFDFDKSSSL